MPDWKPASSSGYTGPPLLHSVEAQLLAFFVVMAVMLTGLYGAWFDPKL